MDYKEFSVFDEAYMQKKFDVCGKLENLWAKAQESLKSEPENIEDEE
jgi:hypothetical protein